VEPLIPVYTAVGVYAALGGPGDPLDHLVSSTACTVGCRDRDLCEALLDPLLSRLRRLPGPASAAIAALMLLEELGSPPRIVYLDVGTRLVPARPGGIVLLREAEVVVEWRGGAAAEETRHQVMPPYGSVLPLPAGRRAERLRQAARYIVELARVYALLLEAGDEPLLVYKHGPMAELLGVYLNPAYNADDRLYRAALLYAGLDDSTASKLLSAAALPGGEVNAGLLALELLRGIAEVMASRRASFAVGVVEDTSTSRLLASTLLAEALYNAARHGLLSFTPTFDKAVDDLAQLVERGVAEVRRWRGDCLEPGAWSIDARGFASELLSALHSRALAWGAGVSTLLVKPERLAAAVYQEASRILESSDMHLVLDAAYLYGLGVTGPFADPATRGLARQTLDRAELGPGPTAHAESSLGALAHLYSYAAPWPLPSCESLERLSSRLGVSPDLLATLSRVKQPIRVDTVALVGDACRAAERLVSAAALAQLAASVSAYGLPGGLITADARSRVGFKEALILAELARRLAGRLVPYGVALRHWPRRGATI